MKHFTLIFLLTILFSAYHTTHSKTPKIVGIMAFRNEANFLAQHLKALSLYTDAIVVLDDASTDDSLAIAQSLQEECNIEKIITKDIWFRDEPGDRNKLLEAGREIGGTHFIAIDADEMFTSNLLIDNQLRNLILTLKPKETISVMWIQLWRSINFYRYDSSVWTNAVGEFIFCDDGTSAYNSDFIHTGRIPFQSKRSYKLSTYDVGLLHFQFVNWDNLLLKQAWYRCLERVRLPNKVVEEINKLYAPSKNEEGLERQPSKLEWFGHYSFFDASVYDKPDNWRKKQVNQWFNEYGKEYFSELDIWDIDWNIQ
jgi:glycosyltransferase involved in cell wall biosynthesis